ncbi:hypothetical protein GCM10022288_09390 [Gryllotalpicola kribbensis]|jgi:hypothetical protein|uniref:Uncharacterized protein n=1 Tax=Gryllotalpicola kribbensis TaxID=993084 RepID=A0ABP8AM76_9MICO
MSLVSTTLHRLSRAVHVAPAVTLADVEVVAVGDGDWRISLPGGSPFALLGFVTLSDGRYRVQSLTRPFAEFEADSLEHAIDALRPPAADASAILAGIRPARAA